MARILSVAFHVQRLFSLFVAILLLVALPQQTFAAAQSASAWPKLILWAWERPENLNFIDSSRTGVAFLAASLILSENAVLIHLRHQPLYVPPHTPLIAVVHVGDRPGHMPGLSPFQEAQILQVLLALSVRPDYLGVQLDYEAPPSERLFYRHLIRSLHARLPANKILSVTALSSSCLGDNWLTGLPADEIVPMLFSMGHGTDEVTGHFAQGGDFSSANCRHSLGVSVQELGIFRLLPGHRRIYAFNAHAWTWQDYQVLRQRFSR